MLVIIVTCQGGRLLWVQGAHGHRNTYWRCTRDGFEVASPLTPSGAETQLVALVQHSATLLGTVQSIQQVVL